MEKTWGEIELILSHRESAMCGRKIRFERTLRNMEMAERIQFREGSNPFSVSLLLNQLTI